MVQRSAHAMAWLAVALLTFATVQSVVMQAPEVSPGAAMAICTSMPMAHMDAKHGAPADKAHTNCAFCDAAAHAPVCSSVGAVPTPTAVAWLAYTALRPLGPRGPPEFTPNATGPPQTAMTL